MYINIYLERERASGGTARKKRDILWVAVVWADVDSHGNELSIAIYIIFFFFPRGWRWWLLRALKKKKKVVS